MTTLIPKYDLGLTGAVNRPFNQKLAETISVKDFGAVGDGSANDAPAFQAAINAVGYGGSLYIPEGTYKFNSVVNVPAFSGLQANINFIGAGGNTTITPGATVDSLFYVTGANVTFTGIAFSNASSYATSGLKIIDDSGDAAFSALVQDCFFIGFTYGIYAEGQNFGIQNNFFQNELYHIYFYNDGRNTYVDNNYMLGGNNGIVFNKTTVQAEGARIVNNTILVTDGNGQGIGLAAGLEIYIAFNIIDQTGDNSPAINMNAAASGGTVSRIKIISNWLCAGKNSYGIFASGNSNHLDVIDNTFPDNGKVISAGISYSTVNISNIAFNSFLLISGNSEYSSSGSGNIEFLMNVDRTDTPMASVINGPVEIKGQLSTGALPIDPAAAFQVASTTQGVLFPNMTTTQKNAIASPPRGLVVFDTTLNKLCVLGASAWETITSV